MRKFLFFLLLVPFVHSFDCAFDVKEFIFDPNSGVGFLIGAVLAFSVAIITLAYLFGSSLNNAQLLVFSKDELFHLFMSVLIFISISGIFTLSCLLFGYIGDFAFSHIDNLNSPCPVSPNFKTLSLCYLGEIEDKAESIHKDYIKKSFEKQRDSAWAFSLDFPFMGTVITSTKAFRKTEALQYDTLSNAYIVPVLVSILVQKQSILFLTDYALRWVLPFGFLFRIFMPTRQMGNMLIAFAIGAYLFIPLMYTFNAAMYYSVLPDCSAHSSAIDDYVQGSCSKSGSFWDISKLLPQAFFLPNLTIVVFITFLAAANKALRVIS